ncbi:DUF2804 domain-containing protein [Agitococcus lubricus]|uniref:Uncharacterized protein DUF2804 n=1 Tax=Agitococcus lubricus TaxID=1077255 RepID=A0A2T5IWW0_9GAMM|nr:DUF2804 domain-containing protein [Agitococcus lubricus]PTQ88422.1 uncharacterized protein DUF2804 [Agitococcus lubricus]
MALHSPLSALEPLIDNGKPRFGYFDDALSIINSHDFSFQNPFGEQRSSLARWLSHKEFQYFGGMSERYIFGCALANLAYVAMAFVYVYDIQHQKLWSRSWRSPLGVGFHFADNPCEGETRFKIPLIVDICLGYQKQPRQKTLLIQCKELTLEARMTEDNLEPMSICTRTGYNGWAYTAKSAGQPLFGFIKLHQEQSDLASIGAYGSLDFSTGFMRRETWWNWACSAGVVQRGDFTGQALGLNLSTGVNETSFSENCFWLGGICYPLAQTQFDFNQKNINEPWRIRTHDGVVNLQFSPLGMHREKVRAGLLNTHFRQLFGEFSGCIILNQQEICLDGLKGFVEDQYIKW